MLRKRTTFVLGAGASSELGFPLGGTLQSQIQAAARGHRTHVEDGSSHPEVDIIRATGYDRDELLISLELIERGLSLSQSIDAFLFNNRHRQCVVDCGKLLILQAILHAELKSPMSGEEQAKHFCERRLKEDKDRRYENPYKVPPQTLALTNSYLGSIWTEIAATHDIHDVEKIFAGLSFVNFNYDRSLEMALLYCLTYNFGLDETQALKLIDDAEIVRPYGSPHGNAAFATAVPKFGVKDVDPNVALKNFRTYTEAVDEQVAAKAKRLVADSEVLVFLGFGFHPQNMDLLTVSDCTDKRVYFSYFGESEANRLDLAADLSKRLGVQRAAGRKIAHSDIHASIGTSVETLSKLKLPIFRSASQ